VQLVESALARLRAVDPWHADIALAALFAAVSVVELLHLDPGGHSRPVTVAAAAISMSGLAFRRRDPLIAVAIFVVPEVLQAFLDGYMTKNSTAPFVAAILLLYSIGRYSETRRLAPALVLLIAGLMTSLLVEAGFEGFSDIFWAGFLFGLPTLAGRALRSRVLLQAELKRKADRAELERAERARAAVEDERVRIAAELQELVANGLSAMVVQAGAVPRAVTAGDSGRAGAALAAVETTGRAALNEMRTLLGVLRREGEGATLAPQPGLARLAALVERNRARGLTVSLRHEGWRRDLAAGVDLTAYRVVEDALDAAVERDALSAEVLVRYRPRELRLQVRDDRRADGEQPLGALRERVALYGGHLRAERVDDGFRLRVGLPLEEGA
jgi:signal transduction histidine kinase